MRVYDLFLAVADSSSVVNWIDNGGFTAFDHALTSVKNESYARRGFDPLNLPDQTIVDATVAYDVVDIVNYAPITYSGGISEAPQKNIGSWEIYGASGSVTIAPKIDNKFLYSFDGGNLLVVSADPGTVILDQHIEYFLPLLGEEVTVAFSGRKLRSATKVEVMLLVDEVPALTIVTQSQFFGEYKRQSKSTVLPKEGKKMTLRIKLSSLDSFSFGLSGISLVMGSMPLPPFTPSLADVTIPSGTVILYEGAACPAGYVSIGAGRMALVSGMPARLDESSGISEAGSATHDHNQLFGAIDGLEEGSTAEHNTAGVSDGSLLHIKGVLENSLNNLVGGAYAHSIPAAALTREHTHSVQSNMPSLPPCFPTLFCKKI